MAKLSRIRVYRYLLVAVVPSASEAISMCQLVGGEDDCKRKISCESLIYILYNTFMEVGFHAYILTQKVSLYFVVLSRIV